jgi:sugar phosphate isomerase/epimerase
MRKFGFKFYSSDLTNTPDLIKECAKFASSVSDVFIELMVVPSSSLADLKKIKKQVGDLEVRIHAPHDGMGFDPANKELEQQNKNLVALAQKAADFFNSKTIVVHAGCGHGQQYIDETVRQFKLFNDSRIIVENLPYMDNGVVPMHGSRAEEIAYIMRECGCGFCFDFSHAICAALTCNMDVDKQLKSFFDLRPAVYHICDGYIDKDVDLHLHLNTGTFPLAHMLNDFTAPDAYITIETGVGKVPQADLKIKDYQYLKSLQTGS